MLWGLGVVEDCGWGSAGDVFFGLFFLLFFFFWVGGGCNCGWGSVMCSSCCFFGGVGGSVVAGGALVCCWQRVAGVVLDYCDAFAHEIKTSSDRVEQDSRGAA